MSLNIEKHAGSAHAFINEVAAALGIPEHKEKAGRVLTAVLHALRNRITPEESIHLIAQLPLYIKGVYVSNWKIGEPFHRIKHLDQFLDEVVEEGGMSGEQDFPTREHARKAVAAVFTVIKNHVSEGEEEDIRTMLPKELQRFWENPVTYKQ